MILIILSPAEFGFCQIYISILLWIKDSTDDASFERNFPFVY